MPCRPAAGRAGRKIKTGKFKSETAEKKAGPSINVAAPTLRAGRPFFILVYFGRDSHPRLLKIDAHNARIYFLKAKGGRLRRPEWAKYNLSSPNVCKQSLPIYPLKIFQPIPFICIPPALPATATLTVHPFRSPLPQFPFYDRCGAPIPCG